MYIIGILIGLYLKSSVVFLCILLLIFSILLYLLKGKISYIIFIFCIIIGSLYIFCVDLDYQEFFKTIEGEVEIKAIVISEPEEKEYKVTYNIKIVQIDGNSVENGKKLIFNLKKKENISEIPVLGDEILITSKIEKPDKARNYKGFSYETYLKSKRIYGIVESNSVEILSHNNINIINKSINSIQNNLEKNMNEILNEDEAALCTGILIGIREQISEEIEDNFRKSNLTHMLAVSGSHITYIITVFANTLGKTNKKFTKGFTIVFLIFFMALTGFTASVIRACIMGILVLLASILNRKSDTINNIGISSLIILLINPYTITDLGFLLSYGGTIGIVALGGKINERVLLFINKFSRRKSITKNKKSIFNLILKYILDSFSITLSANLIIIPIMAYSFSTFSFTFWISNILAAPIMEIVTIFGFLIYFISIIVFPLAKFLGIFLNVLLSILLKIAQISSLIPGSSIYIKTPYILECIIYYIIIAIGINKNKINEIILLFNSKKTLISKIKRNIHKILALILIFLTVFNLIFSNISKKLTIYFVDVGQGDCTLIKTMQNKTVLVDGGGSEFGNFDVGENILLPYLLDRRIKKIDYIIISHFDSDHVGGLFAVMENLDIKNIVISKQGENSENFKKFKDIVEKKKINVIIVKKGDYIKIDKYSYLEILFPTEQLIQENVLNNNSIVFKFNTMGINMLFTGDIEEIAEKQLAQIYEGTSKLEADILKVAHHGSKTSSTEKFLELVSPKIALIGVGEDNNFGHPNSIVIDRLRKYTSMIYRTDKHGEIVLNYKHGNININTFLLKDI